MASSSYSSFLPLLSLFLFLLLPHFLLATDYTLKLSHTPASHTPDTPASHTPDTPASLPLLPPSLPRHPLTSPLVPPVPIKSASLPPDPVLPASLPPVTSSPDSPSTPVPPPIPVSPTLAPPSKSNSSTHDPSTPDHPSPVPSTPELSTPAPKDRPHKTGGDAGAGASENKVEGKKGKDGLLVVNHFYLWTRRNIANKSPQLLNPSSNKTIIGSYFRPRKTFIIIHGFCGWGTEAWILQLKDKLLQTINSNVISVDWPAGSSWWLLSYYTAVVDVPYVAKDLTDLLHGLVTLWSLDLADVHLIGHSLGAHIAGLAAAPLSTVGRISGLDPAGLTYHNVPASQRLDSTDADYVDVIHTNGCKTLNVWLDCYGINENLGHSDFWPNGGRHQPSCGSRKRTQNGEIGCSHEMAYIYYIESLSYNVDQTYFLARPCSSWEDFSTGNCSCGWETQYMGFSVNMKLKGTYYLHTNSTAPYATQDSACYPGSVTGSGVRSIELTLISSSALIVTGAGIGAIALQVIKRRSATRRESGREGGSDSGVSGVSDTSEAVDENADDDCEALLP